MFSLIKIHCYIPDFYLDIPNTRGDKTFNENRLFFFHNITVSVILNHVRIVKIHKSDEFFINDFTFRFSHDVLCIKHQKT